ncbi:hypothetical protein HGG65_07630 [Alteromonadaceae bacterium A_SAG4]|uniref:hypothetical protein n=1 Tax=Alteromonas abrolhosensis TaxID=1892904 RepID=UPI00144899A1|nr:hypothetical protein [Alteromonadaceae bacterium A_SAG4]NKX05163.1 hypothetical protein [Alteromonadaceae bacterium A_SAG6]NKX19491.1 hypothetical protein [Alteromonadaceae bacterium A_SAG8]NKX35614.1 hypothetical protein [Alteromonadaceae bacterium A_SAG3]NKX69600.1 hypothetical protein [Alteromonadaceae bacterium A_SAG7]
MKSQTVNRVTISRERLDVALRTLIAVALGYAFSAWLSSAIANFIGTEGREHEALVRMLFFCIYCTFILFTFMFDTAKKATIVMTTLSALALCLYSISTGL